MLAKSGRFFTLGVCLGLALRAFSSWSLAGRIRAGIFIALSVAVGIEVLQWACPARYPDITHVMLAFAGALCGMITIQWWLDVIKAYHPQQDDRAAAAIQ